MLLNNLKVRTSAKGQRVRKRRNESVRDRAELGEGAVSPCPDSTPHATVIAKVGLSSLTEVARVAVPEVRTIHNFVGVSKLIVDKIPAWIDGHSVAGLELFHAFSDRLHSTDKLMTQSYRVRARGAELTLSKKKILNFYYTDDKVSSW